LRGDDVRTVIGRGGDAVKRSLEGVAAVVTGASSGIGRETALRMARMGARLVLLARGRERLEAAAAEIRGGGGAAVVCPGDVAEPGVMEAAVDACVSRYGRLDVLINNAGSGFFGSVEQTTVDDLDSMLDVNFKGTFHGIKAAVPVMRRQGRGHIVNVASTAGRRGSPYVGAYCAAKFAVVGLTESLRVELLDSGIEVSLVCPGATRTNFFEAARRRTQRHHGLVGPIETAERAAERILAVVRRPRAEALAQPIRRKAFFILNLLAPGATDRLLAGLIDGFGHRPPADIRP
jgi:short-subunit dehydrogenase